jgi:hypothetical protein
MCYVCCVFLLLLSSSILHFIPRHQPSPMPSAGTHWPQHCRPSNPLLLSHQHHNHYHNHRPHYTMSTCTIKAVPYCCCWQSTCLRCDAMFFMPTINPWLVLVVVVASCDVHVSMVLRPTCWLCCCCCWLVWSIGCFFVSVVQGVSNISCRDVLCILCFVAAVVFHPPLHPMPSTNTEVFFCWHSLAPALSC